ncbi:MAG: hypothetical protein KDE27_04160 [Planctomycetes bacterium]|nr:hypothetical protein [Planctomycetota bacterium]
MKKLLVVATAVVVVAVLSWTVVRIVCAEEVIVDEATAAGLAPKDFPQLRADVFRGMDGATELTPEQVMGRNSWNMWTAGNSRFWDRMARESYGIMDLLKVLDSRNRSTRFAVMGVMNEPGFKAATGPDRYGLWLDVRDESSDEHSIDDAIRQEFEGTDVDWQRAYGRSTGILGLRLFDNPAFDAEARRKWDAKRYYDPSERDYWSDPTLVRPYRVGVACGLCHISPHPLHPPGDPEQPKWENLASAIGAQYFKEGEVFASVTPRSESFLWQMMAAQPRGTSDTSRIATDHINNPNTINAIFNLESREAIAASEEMAGGTLALPPATATRDVPHILKDGADSVGVPGATIRVYVNIGLFSEYWLSQHKPLLGLSGQEPFEVPYAQQHSTYWMATQERLVNIRAFLATIRPMHLRDAPGGAAFVTDDAEVLARGRRAFAQHCAECHSSKQPPAGVQHGSPEWQRFFADSVDAPDFLVDNFLSDERRYPVNREGLGTNSSRALATNAIAAGIWDNFSSATYKDLAAVGTVTGWDPFANAERGFRPPGGGPGYYRTPSLIGIWSSAPFLHNNALGTYTGDPSVAGRIRAFEDAAEKLLWPEKRPGTIWCTTERSWIKIPERVVPKLLRGALELAADRLAGVELFEGGVLGIGPIPKGTPINLLMSLDLKLADLRQLGHFDGDLREIGEDRKQLHKARERIVALAGLVLKTKRLLRRIEREGLDDAAGGKLLATELGPELLAESKCPDFIEDKGHTFGERLPDGDKHALIEFLKTL